MSKNESEMYITHSLALNSMPAGGAIIGIKGNILGVIYRIKGNREIILGRDPYCSDVVVMGKRVSRIHCGIVYVPDSNEYLVVDYSSNGCFLPDGRRLEKDKPYRLPVGEEVILADQENVIRLG